MKRALRFAAQLLLTSLLGAQTLPAQVPRIERPVTDQAGVLSPSCIASMEAEVAEHRRETGVQIAVLIVATTGDLPIEEFSLKVAESWAGGSRGRDDGILLTIAVEDRTMRTEVGYGLEPCLTDARARQIQEGLREGLRAGDYNGAVRRGVKGLMAATAMVELGKPIPRPPVPLGARMPWAYLGVFYLGAAAAAVTFLQPNGPARAMGWKVWNWAFGLGVPLGLGLLFAGGGGFWWFYPVLFAASAGMAFLVLAIWDDHKVGGITAGLWFYAVVPAAFLWRGQLGGPGTPPDRWDGEELLMTAVAHLFGCVFISVFFPMPLLLYFWSKQDRKGGGTSGLGAFVLSGGSSGSTRSWSSGGSGSSGRSGGGSSWSGGGGRFGGGGATSSW